MKKNDELKFDAYFTCSPSSSLRIEKCVSIRVSIESENTKRECRRITKKNGKNFFLKKDTFPILLELYSKIPRGYAQGA